MSPDPRILVKPGDKCLDTACEGKLIIALICDDDDCGGTVHPADDYIIEIPGLLSKVQATALKDFLLEHKLDVSNSPNRVILNKVIKALGGVQ